MILQKPIIEKYKGGPVGSSTLAVSLSEEIGTIEEFHEPYLIQLGLIESDLIQAVGRARTLRTEAIVELYSNFPLRISHQFVWNTFNKKEDK